jgi:hypothetical protein
MSEVVALAPTVTLPLESTVTLVYVPAVTPELANVSCVLVPVVPVPVTSPVKVNAPDIEAVDTEVIRPLESTVTTGTRVEDPYVPGVTAVLASVSSIEVVPDPVASPEIVTLWLPVTYPRLATKLRVQEVVGTFVESSLLAGAVNTRVLGNVTAPVVSSY